MELNKLNERIKRKIAIGSIVKSKGDYPFGFVTGVDWFKIHGHWYKTLSDLKSGKNKKSNNGVIVLNVWNNEDVKLV